MKGIELKLERTINRMDDLKESLDKGEIGEKTFMHDMNNLIMIRDFYQESLKGDGINKKKCVAS